MPQQSFAGGFVISVHAASGKKTATFGQDFAENRGLQAATRPGCHTVALCGIKSTVKPLFALGNGVLRLVAVAPRLPGGSHRLNHRIRQPRFAERVYQPLAFEFQLAVIAKVPIHAPAAPGRGVAKVVFAPRGGGNQKIKARRGIGFIDFDDLRAHAVSRHGACHKNGASVRQVTHAVPQIVEVGDVKVKQLPFLHTVMGDIRLRHKFPRRFPGTDTPARRFRADRS